MEGSDWSLFYTLGSDWLTVYFKWFTIILETEQKNDPFVVMFNNRRNMIR